MSRRNAKKTIKDAKQPTLAAFINKPNASDTSSGIKKIRKIFNVFVNVNLKSRIGKRTAKIIHFVSAVPETETSSISSEPKPSTSAAVCAERRTIDNRFTMIDSTTVNVTLNVTTDMEVVGK